MVAGKRKVRRTVTAAAAGGGGATAVVLAADSTTSVGEQTSGCGSCSCGGSCGSSCMVWPVGHVISHGKDGRHYLGRVLQTSTGENGAEKCLVGFDNGTSAWSLRHHVRPLCDRSQLCCFICNSSPAPPQQLSPASSHQHHLPEHTPAATAAANYMVRCLVCRRAVHWRCVRPPHPCATPRAWRCAQCTPSLTSSSTTTTTTSSSSNLIGFNPSIDCPKQQQQQPSSSASSSRHHHHHHEMSGSNRPDEASADVGRGGVGGGGGGTCLPYDRQSLHWDEQHRYNSCGRYCYCGGPADCPTSDGSGSAAAAGGGMWQCCDCRQWFHRLCVRPPQPLLPGDCHFRFRCRLCTGSGRESWQRCSADVFHWPQLVHLALYNLHLLHDQQQQQERQQQHHHEQRSSDVWFHVQRDIVPWLSAHWSRLLLPPALQQTAPTAWSDHVTAALTDLRHARHFTASHTTDDSHTIGAGGGGGWSDRRWRLCRASSPPPPPSPLPPLPPPPAAAAASSAAAAVLSLAESTAPVAGGTAAADIGCDDNDSAMSSDTDTGNGDDKSGTGDSDGATTPPSLSRAAAAARGGRRAGAGPAKVGAHGRMLRARSSTGLAATSLSLQQPAPLAAPPAAGKQPKHHHHHQLLAGTAAGGGVDSSSDERILSTTVGGGLAALVPPARGNPFSRHNNNNSHHHHSHLYRHDDQHRPPLSSLALHPPRAVITRKLSAKDICVDKHGQVRRRRRRKPALAQLGARLASVGANTSGVGGGGGVVSGEMDVWQRGQWWCGDSSSAADRQQPAAAAAVAATESDFSCESTASSSVTLRLLARRTTAHGETQYLVIWDS